MKRRPSHPKPQLQPQDRSALAEEQESELLRKARAGHLDSRNRLVECNLWLVDRISSAYKRRCADPEDLFQEGCKGLIRAVERFDAQRGCRFGTFASIWINGSIRRFLKKWGRRTAMRLVATSDENDIIDSSEDKDTPFRSRRFDGPETLVEQRELQDLTEIAVRKLPAKHSLVIKRRFGLRGSGGKAMGQRDVANLIGRTRPRVSKIEAEAFALLRRNVQHAGWFRS